MSCKIGNKKPGSGFKEKGLFGGARCSIARTGNTVIAQEGALRRAEALAQSWAKKDTAHIADTTNNEHG